MTFDKPIRCENRELLVAFTDLENYLAISRKLDGQATFSLINSIDRLIADTIEAAGGYFVKNLGDGSLLIFDGSQADAGIRALLDTKAAVEALLRSMGFANRLRVSAHVGEVLVGPSEPHGQLDVFGETVNRAALVGSGAYRGELVLSPEAFRSLRPETRKRFARHIREVVYRASVGED